MVGGLAWFPQIQGADAATCISGVLPTRVQPAQSGDSTASSDCDGARSALTPTSTRGI